jgi:hypothetical protein
LVHAFWAAASVRRSPISADLCGVWPMAGQHAFEAVQVYTRITPLLVQLSRLSYPKGPASDWRCSSVFAHGGPEAVVLVTEEQPAEDAGDGSTDRRPA